MATSPHCPVTGETRCPLISRCWFPCYVHRQVVPDLDVVVTYVDLPLFTGYRAALYISHVLHLRLFVAGTLHTFGWFTHTTLATFPTLQLVRCAVGYHVDWLQPARLFTVGLRWLTRLLPR